MRFFTLFIFKLIVLLVFPNTIYSQVNVEKFRKSTSERGFSGNVGIDLSARMMTIDNLISAVEGDSSAIVHMNDSEAGHYIVVNDMSEDTVKYTDINGNDHEMSVDDFNSYWSGNALAKTEVGAELSVEQAKDIMGAETNIEFVDATHWYNYVLPCLK